MSNYQATSQTPLDVTSQFEQRLGTSQTPLDVTDQFERRQGHSQTPLDAYNSYDNRQGGSSALGSSNLGPSSNASNYGSSGTAATDSTNGNLGAQAANLKDSLIGTASATFSTVANHPTSQQVKDTVVNGPVGQTVQRETAKTSSEFQDLANARTVPDHRAATGQRLTQYHSLFYRLLSWKNPRATGIVFASLVSLIFASRYVSFASYAFKAIYTVLGITALAEGAGKATIGQGFTSQIRPRKYYTIRKESLERTLDDVEQLINFSVIEAQRILFVENIYVTGLAFTASFLSYFLIKLLPFWGLTLLATLVTFLSPLIYIKNKTLIDQQLNRAGNVITTQASQVRDIAAQNTQKASESIRTYAEEYSHKAQELIDNARGKVANGANQVTSSSTGVSHSSKGPAFPVTTKDTGLSNTGSNLPTQTAGGSHTSQIPVIPVHPAGSGLGQTSNGPDFPVVPRTEPIIAQKPVTTTTNITEPVIY